MMINKRGIGQEVDWIIGIGLFMLSIVFIFILFRPGISKPYDAKTLLDILQEGLDNDTQWDIMTVPVFVYPANEINKADIALVELSPKKIDLSCTDNICKPEPYDGLTRLLRSRNKVNIRAYYIKKSDKDPAPKEFIDKKNKLSITHCYN